jgi:hypothetical protein
MTNSSVLNFVADSLERYEPGTPGFKMVAWAQGYPNDDVCQTVGCIAGHIVFHFDRAVWYEALRVDPAGFRQNGLVSKRAGKLAGLDPQVAGELFSPNLSLCDIDRKDAAKMLRWLAEHPEAEGSDVERKWLEICPDTAA